LLHFERVARSSRIYIVGDVCTALSNFLVTKGDKNSESDLTCAIINAAKSQVVENGRAVSEDLEVAMRQTNNILDDIVIL
jgi:hypothetical protein